MEPEQVRNIMDSMIRKLYDMELEEQGRSDWQDEKIKITVKKILETISHKRYNKVKGVMRWKERYTMAHRSFWKNRNMEKV